MSSVPIPIPGSLYERAAKAAKAHHVTIEAFVAEAVQLHLQSDDEEDLGSFFTPQAIVEIRQAAAEARLGNNLAPEQVEAHFAAKREAWLANHPS